MTSVKLQHVKVYIKDSACGIQFIRTNSLLPYVPFYNIQTTVVLQKVQQIHNYHKCERAVEAARKLVFSVPPYLKCTQH